MSFLRGFQEVKSRAYALASKLEAYGFGASGCSTSWLEVRCVLAFKTSNPGERVCKIQSTIHPTGLICVKMRKIHGLGWRVWVATFLKSHLKINKAETNWNWILSPCSQVESPTLESRNLKLANNSDFFLTPAKAFPESSLKCSLVPNPKRI